MRKEIDIFRKCFEKYQHLLGLTGYKVYFKYEPIDSSFADIHINQVDMVATVTLNNKLPDKDKPFKDIKRSAKHEALHLLLGRLETRARERYTTGDEIYEAIEELVFKLEKLLSEEKEG